MVGGSPLGGRCRRSGCVREVLLGVLGLLGRVLAAVTVVSFTGRGPLPGPRPRTQVTTRPAPRVPVWFCIGLIEGLNSLECLTSSHVGFGLPSDVLVHGLLGSALGPFEVRCQQVGDLVDPRLAEPLTEVIHQDSHTSMVCDPAWRLSSH